MNSLVSPILYNNTLTCPKCGSKQDVKMLSLEFSSVYQCDHCNQIIKSSKKKCCVYCEYGDVKCPSEQVRWN